MTLTTVSRDASASKKTKPQEGRQGLVPQLESSPAVRVGEDQAGGGGGGDAPGDKVHQVKGHEL